MSGRGTYGFEVQPNENLVDSPNNLERLRNLFRDTKIISGRTGPGEAGDFDNGSWHILCHLAGGAGVYRLEGQYFWVGITHKESVDEYEATVTFRDSSEIRTINLKLAESQELVKKASLQGFVEGSSCGHILARAAKDSSSVFNGWRRQDFDKPGWSKKPGGTVWEHWCTTRDIRGSNAVSNSLLGAYLTLIANLGGRFVAAVARGRREHEHPFQLCALVKAGVLTDIEATWDTLPLSIPADVQKKLYEARAVDYVKAAELLKWNQANTPRYFMFKRGINSWNPSAMVRADLTLFDSK